MKHDRRISYFVQTCLWLCNSSSENTLKGCFVPLNRFNFMRIRCPRRAEAFPWAAHLCGSAASVLAQVPSSLLWEECK